MPKFSTTQIRTYPRQLEAQIEELSRRLMVQEQALRGDGLWGGQMVPLPASLVQVKPGFTVALELTEQVGVVNLTGQEKAVAIIPEQLRNRSPAIVTWIQKASNPAVLLGLLSTVPRVGVLLSSDCSCLDKPPQPCFALLRPRFGTGVVSLEPITTAVPSQESERPTPPSIGGSDIRVLDDTRALFQAGLAGSPWRIGLDQESAVPMCYSGPNGSKTNFKETASMVLQSMRVKLRDASYSPALPLIYIAFTSQASDPAQVTAHYVSTTGLLLAARKLDAEDIVFAKLGVPDDLTQSGGLGAEWTDVLDVEDEAGNPVATLTTNPQAELFVLDQGSSVAVPRARLTQGGQALSLPKLQLLAEAALDSAQLLIGDRLRIHFDNRMSADFVQGELVIWNLPLQVPRSRRLRVDVPILRILVKPVEVPFTIDLLEQQIASVAQSCLDQRVAIASRAARWNLLLEDLQQLSGALSGQLKSSVERSLLSQLTGPQTSRWYTAGGTNAQALGTLTALDSSASEESVKNAVENLQKLLCKYFASDGFGDLPSPQIGGDTARKDNKGSTADQVTWTEQPSLQMRPAGNSAAEIQAWGSRIRQGQVGDCYFLAAVMQWLSYYSDIASQSFVELPSVTSELLPRSKPAALPSSWRASRRMAIRLFSKQGEFWSVHTDMAALQLDGSFLTGRTAPPSLFVTLLEHAFCQYNEAGLAFRSNPSNSLAAIEGGYGPEAFGALTGFKSLMIAPTRSLPQVLLYPNQTDGSPASIEASWLSWIRQTFAGQNSRRGLTLGCNSDSSGLVREVKGHMFFSFADQASGAQLVANPWGVDAVQVSAEIQNQTLTLTLSTGNPILQTVASSVPYTSVSFLGRDLLRLSNQVVSVSATIGELVRRAPASASLQTLDLGAGPVSCIQVIWTDKNTTLNMLNSPNYAEVALEGSNLVCDGATLTVAELVRNIASFNGLFAYPQLEEIVRPDTLQGTSVWDLLTCPLELPLADPRALSDIVLLSS